MRRAQRKMSSENPRKWRFTWEAQSHSSTLRLFLFDSFTKPSTKCRNLYVLLDAAESQLSVSWVEEDGDGEVSLRAPIPRVLVDSDSPVSFRALEDHIEVKLVLLLPVDHPLVSSFDSVLNLSDERKTLSDAPCPLQLDSDLKSLSSMQAEGVNFYCRNCSVRLTKKPLRNFREMPSIDWTEAADNWFGGCCCSFDGASEKLVAKYAKSYTCVEGLCLVNTMTITLSQDDLVEIKFFDGKECQPERDTARENGSCEAALTSQKICTEAISFSCTSETRNDFSEKPNLSDLKDDNHAELVHCPEHEPCFHELHHAATTSTDEDVALASGCCLHRKENIDDQQDVSVENMANLMANQKLFLNGFLGNVFMSRSSNLSTDIGWTEFLCPQCVSPLGAYPVSNGIRPVDGGVRLFKCCVSTSVPACVSSNLFRKYTLERMFTNQLFYAAQDELSFRTLVRDLATKSPMLQIILLNTNAWCCSGYCLDTVGYAMKPALMPMVKVLFTECRNMSESQSRLLEDWVRKNQADEVFMFPSQVDELMECLASAREMLPPSCKSLQGLCLSSLQR